VGADGQPAARLLCGRQSSDYRLMEKYRCPAVETNFANFGDFRIFSVQKYAQTNFEKNNEISLKFERKG
jgi:hypothetical protein